MSKTEGCKTQILKNTTLTAALLLSTQGSVMAAPVVSYVMTGSFNTPGVLEVSDANSGDTVPDTEILSDPFFPGAFFSLSFDVDLGVSGSIPAFSSSAFFDSAVTNMSLSIEGSPYWSGSAATVRQTDPIFPPYPDVWAWDSSIYSGGVFNPPVDELIAIDSNTSGYLATLTPESVGIALRDSSRTLYDTSSVLDLISFDGSEFDAMDLSISWVAEAYDQDGNMISDYEAYYELTGTIENVYLTAVPVPAAIWLFGSGLLAFGGLARSRRAA